MSNTIQSCSMWTNASSSYMAKEGLERRAVVFGVQDLLRVSCKAILPRSALKSLLVPPPTQFEHSWTGHRTAVVWLIDVEYGADVIPDEMLPAFRAQAIATTRNLMLAVRVNPGRKEISSNRRRGTDDSRCSNPRSSGVLSKQPT